MRPGRGAALLRGPGARRPAAGAVFGLGDPARGAGRQSRLAPDWRDPAPKPAYDVVMSAAAGMGLRPPTTLRKPRHANVAVLERGYLGGGNVGRNTTIVRANYLLRGNSEFYSHSLKLWEGLEQELNYNVMMSQRGVLNLCHSDGQFDAFARRGNAMRLQGDDAELLDREGVRALAPFLTSALRDFRSAAGCCTGAAERRGTTRWPGASREERMRAAST